MISTNDVKVLVILLKEISIFSRIKEYAKIESTQLSRSLKKLSSLGAIDKIDRKKHVSYSITTEGKTLLKNTLDEKYKEHIEKAKYYDLLMTKINV
ncbi:hypothetical protein GQ473_02875 [archaeon]|nr:hypothetical protein [archaeon]